MDSHWALFFIKNFFDAASPHTLANLADTERLVSAINEVCFRDMGPNNALQLDFRSLRQPLPALADRSSIIADIPLRINGDPSFVLYYEMFPPGEAISWEVYRDFQYRVIAMLAPREPGGEFKSTVSRSDLEQFVKDVESKFRTVHPSESVVVFTGNIILNSGIDPKTGKEIKKKTAEAEQQVPFGRWEEKIGLFVFTGEQNLLDKTLVKYMSCGDGSLCMRTKDGIKKYPLEQCTAAGVDYIELFVVNPPSEPYSTDFNLVSPCSVQTGLKIYKHDECKCKEITYPIYKYEGSDQFVKAGEHTKCLNNIDGHSVPEKDVKCVTVEIFGNKIDGHCFTYSPISLLPPSPRPVQNSNEYADLRDSSNKKFGDVITLKPPGLVRPQGFWSAAVAAVTGNGWPWP